MTSPFELRLDESIRTAPTEIDRAALIAELACYYARIGEFAAAEQLRADLRARFGDGRSLVVSVLVMNLEGLLQYFRDLDLRARDRFQRANLLSTAAGHRALIAFTSSWLAHIEFNSSLFADMHGTLKTGFEAVGSDDRGAECRLSIVLGDAFTSVGNSAAARQWYERARLLATASGDHATIGALTYNRAALKVARARVEDCKGTLSDEDLLSVRAEVKSAVNYQHLAGLTSLEHLLVSAQIGVLMLERKFDEAISAIEYLFQSNEIPSHYSSKLLHSADKARCHAELGDANSVAREAGALAAADLSQLHFDDRVTVHRALEACCQLLGDSGGANLHRAQKFRFIDSHTAEMRELESYIEEFDKH